MSEPLIKGYCPGALQPMESGDGWVVRIRPFVGCLKPEQARGIARLSDLHGNGILDLSARCNIQIRGVSEECYPALMDGLRNLSLLDPHVQAESRRNVMVTPFFQSGDVTESLAIELTEALAGPKAPDLPAKFGYAVDTGSRPVLQRASADIRIERDASGGLILCADGFEMGKSVTDPDAVPCALDLANWFAETRGDHKRMASLLKDLSDLPAGFDVPRQKNQELPQPGLRSDGVLLGLAFGQLSSATLQRLADLGTLRMTPWRMVFIEGLPHLPSLDDVITKPKDPMLRVVACVGAPACGQAHAPTRPLARQLSARVPEGYVLHVSGCTKGCAHPATADRTLTATPNGFSLIENGRANDVPAQSTLTPNDLIKAL